MDGLEALVKGRGGIQNLPVYGYARKMATWYVKSILLLSRMSLS
jgi:hypothetical protein